MYHLKVPTMRKVSDYRRLINNQGGQIRIFIYGNINERRHQLHEVISGSNLVAQNIESDKLLSMVKAEP
jgi:starch synthase